MSKKIIPILSNYGLFFILLLLIILSSLVSPLFFSYLNITNLLIQSSFTGIIAVGMTFVILTAGIDLSVGSIVGFSSILFASLLHGSVFTFMPDTIFVYDGAPKLTPVFPFPLNFVFVLIVGACIGFFSGFISYKQGIHSFIITLAVMIFTRGLAISYTHGQPLFGMPEYVNFLAYGKLLHIPMPVIVWNARSALFICPPEIYTFRAGDLCCRRRGRSCTIIRDQSWPLPNFPLHCFWIFFSPGRSDDVRSGSLRGPENC